MAFSGVRFGRLGLLSDYRGPSMVPLAATCPNPCCTFARCIADLGFRDSIFRGSNVSWSE